MRQVDFGYNNKEIIMAAGNGDLEGVKFLLKYADPSGAIEKAAENGHLEIVKILLKDPRVDPSKGWPIVEMREYGYGTFGYGNMAIVNAACNGHLEIVKFLLSDPRVNTTAVKNRVIQSAAYNGHLEVVKFLLSDPRVDPTANGNQAIKSAAYNGHLEVVKFLLSDVTIAQYHKNDDKVLLSDPRADYNLSLAHAAENDHLEVVEFLLSDPRVDPTANGNQAIKSASHNNNLEVVKILLDDPRVSGSVNTGYIVSVCKQAKPFPLDTVKFLLAKADRSEALKVVGRMNEKTQKILLGDTSCYFYKNINEIIIDKIAKDENILPMAQARLELYREIRPVRALGKNNIGNSLFVFHMLHSFCTQSNNVKNPRPVLLKDSVRLIAKWLGYPDVLFNAFEKKDNFLSIVSNPNRYEGMVMSIIDSRQQAGLPLTKAQKVLKENNNKKEKYIVM
jgi:ankyrin repeat protein